MNGAQSSFKEWTWAYGRGLGVNRAQSSFNEWTWAYDGDGTQSTFKILLLLFLLSLLLLIQLSKSFYYY